MIGTNAVFDSTPTLAYMSGSYNGNPSFTKFSLLSASSNYLYYFKNPTGSSSNKAIRDFSYSVGLVGTV